MSNPEIVLTLPDGSSARVPPARRRSTSRVRSARAWRRTPSAPSSTAQPVDLRAPLAARRRRSASSPPRTPEAGEFVRHSAEHVLADAVTRLWPEALYDAGRKDHCEKFQYDFRFPRAFTPEDLETIEAKMREIVAEDAPFERVEVSRDGGRATLPRACGNDLKLERLKDIPEARRSPSTATASSSTSAAARTCSAPAQIGAVKLLEASGVYFKGDERNERLQRIYGTAFATAEGARRLPSAGEEARARDHRRLGPGARPVQLLLRWRRPRPSSIPRARWSTTADRLRARAATPGTATTRWSRRRSSTSSSGTPRGTRRTTARTCSSPSSTSASSRSSR